MNDTVWEIQDRTNINPKNTTGKKTCNYAT